MNKRFLRFFRNIFFICLPFSLLGTSCATSQTPEYKGMSITRNTANALYSQWDEEAKAKALKGENPTTSAEPGNQDITTIIPLTTDATQTCEYFVEKNETFTVEVHLSNPKEFEIQSFTLNGKKYSNYMFKSGSTLELLLLDVTAPDQPGFIDYTIDAIKYIDGTEIKDVRMSGEKTIQAGVKYSKTPSVSVSSLTVTTTSISATISVIDSENVIGTNPLNFYISNGSERLFEKALTVGQQTISFSNLALNSKFQYGIAAFFDLADGNGLRGYWLTTQSFHTLNVFGISNLTATKTSVAFDIQENEAGATIQSISCIDATTQSVVATGSDTTTRSFSNLLSNHAYQIKVTFAHSVSGTATQGAEIADFTTIAKKAPVVTISNEKVTETSISGTLSVDDPDALFACTSITLSSQVSGESQSSSLQAYEFDNLSTYTDYSVSIGYSYDLNDGLGLQKTNKIISYRTCPTIAIKNVTILNTTAVNEGDTIVIQAAITNPYKAKFDSVVVNGITYSASSSSSTDLLRIEIKDEGQFAGGDTTLSIDQINCSLENHNFIIAPTATTNSAHIFIYGKLIINSVACTTKVGTEYQSKDYFAPTAYYHYYLYLSLTNPTNYQICSAIVNGMTTSAISMVDTNHAVIQIGGSSGWNNYQLTKLSYSLNGLTSELTNLSFGGEYYVLATDTIKTITTADDLKQMSGSICYQLANDIDLGSYDWTPADFNGVFDGNSHTVRNIKSVKTVIDESVYGGLFKNAEGFIENLTIDNIIIMLTYKTSSGAAPMGDGKCGAFACKAGSLTLKNCASTNSQGGAIIEATGSFMTCCFGGLVGYGSYGSNQITKIENCINEVPLKCSGPVGGIAGYASSIIKCKNTGTCSTVVNERYGFGRAAGIAEYAKEIELCINTGNVTDSKSAAGISVSCPKIVDCINAGVISSSEGTSAGLVSEGANLTGCLYVQKQGSAPSVFGEVTDTTKISSTAYVTAASEVADPYATFAPYSEANTKDFYTKKLGWNETDWTFNELNIANGILPMLA
jgi:hypothetical protein